jgi:phage shock protein PspC (stress-responsive transcriptional regulator)
MRGKKLYKSRRDVKVDGVCAGIGQFLGVDATIIRLLWIIALLCFGSGGLAYIICMLIMPREPDVVDYTDSGHGRPPGVN